MASVGARTWLLAPIQATEHLWGILIVLRRNRSLFIDDDLGLLELFTQQCATMLENYRLIDEIQRYSDQLEARVNERTAQLEFLASASRILAESFDYVVAPSGSCGGTTIWVPRMPPPAWRTLS